LRCCVVAIYAYVLVGSGPILRREEVGAAKVCELVNNGHTISGKRLSLIHVHDV